MKTLDHLFETTELTIEDISERSKLPIERVEAMVSGRWTPSPEDRQKMADAFGVPVDSISWGHTVDPRNIRYRRRGIEESQ